MTDLATLSDLYLIETEEGLHKMALSPEVIDAHTLLTKEMARRGLFFAPLIKASKAKTADAGDGIQDGDKDDETSSNDPDNDEDDVKNVNAKKSANGSGGGDLGNGWIKDGVVVTKRDYTAAERKEAANNGRALPDGSFPINNEADLHNAIRLVGQASNPDAAKEHIISRAKAMGLTSALPDDWQTEDSPKSKTATPTKKSAAERLYDAIRKAFTSDADRAVDELLKKLEDEGDPDIPTHDYAIVKSYEENRYTLGPVYMPNKLDAHDEWASASDLQRSMWDYVKKSASNRTIYLQHSKMPAGEWVEIMTWPMDVTTTLTKSIDGVTKSEEHTFPAGTCYMGVQWEPWAWEEVKDGGITGFSMGGRARRVEAVPES